MLIIRKPSFFVIYGLVTSENNANNKCILRLKCNTLLLALSKLDQVTRFVIAMWITSPLEKAVDRITHVLLKLHVVPIPTLLIGTAYPDCLITCSFCKCQSVIRT